MNALELNSTEEIIADIKAGRMVILMDDADRENEGDLILAGECVTPEAINFMARYGRGLICLTLTEGRCRQLNLPLMVADNNDKNTTNFTVSIEAAQGVTTGISAADRAVTVQAAVKADARPGDIVMPGHIFPLRAQGKDVTRHDDVAGTGVRLDRRLYRHRPVGGGNAGGHALRRLDRDGEIGGVLVVVVGHHQRQVQLPATPLGKRQADQPTPVTGHEVDRLRRHALAGQDEVALVLAVGVVHEDDHPAGLDVGDDLLGTVQLQRVHRFTNPCSASRSRSTPPVSRPIRRSR